MRLKLLRSLEMKIYISGKITGTEDYIERFAKAEKELIEQGYEVINPARISTCLPTLEHEEYMRIDFALLEVCDAIYMLKGWGDSRGAREEYIQAVQEDKLILFEEANKCCT